MIPLLFFSTKSDLNNFCQAPRGHAPKVEDMELVHISVITRHGHRAPEDPRLPMQARGYWTCDDKDAPSPRMESAPSKYYRYYKQILDSSMVDYPPSCRAGDLTIEGMNMHVKLGDSYRKYLVDELKFLPEKMDPSLFDFFSSHKERTFRSAESFINGLYPPLSSNEVINILTSTTKLSPLAPSDKTCQEIKAQKEALYAGPEYQKILEETWPIVKEAAEMFGFEKSVMGMHNTCKWAMAFNCSVGSQGPSFITDEFMEKCRAETWWSQYGQFNYTDRFIGASSTMRYVLKAVDAALQSGKRFALHSAHDTTLSAVLAMLRAPADLVAQYASHLAMELWRDKEQKLFVRFVFNGAAVDLPDFGGPLAAFDAFRGLVDPNIHHCAEIPVA